MKTRRVSEMDPAQIDALRQELERNVARKLQTPRWNADPEDVQRSVLKLVLTLVEFLRKLMERQAIRRMEAGTFSDEETEAVGLALMRLEETVHELARRFNIPPDELNLDLGPLGRLI
ncbi:MAG: gas vesicle protein K [Myxococcota bacterium]